MKLVNTEGVPAPIIAAIIAADETYRENTFLHLQKVRYDEQFSVTTLARPPRQHQLYRRYYDRMEIDVRRRFYILNGSIIHYILEKYPTPGALAEVRKGVVFLYQGKRIYVHGACDEFQDWMNDWKNTAVGILKRPKSIEKYVFQLNVLRFIWEHHKIKINKLRNTLYFRDWNMMRALRDPDYPQMFTKVVDQPIWDDATLKAKLIERIKLHTSYANTPDDELPHCTPEEQWRDESYRIIAKTKKGEWALRSSGSGETEKEARELAAEKGITEFKIEQKHGEPTNCMYWCDAAPFCRQYQNELTLLHNDERKMP